MEQITGPVLTGTLASITVRPSSVTFFGGGGKGGLGDWSRILVTGKRQTEGC